MLLILGGSALSTARIENPLPLLLGVPISDKSATPCNLGLIGIVFGFGFFFFFSNRNNENMFGKAFKKMVFKIYVLKKSVLKKMKKIFLCSKKNHIVLFKKK